MFIADVCTPHGFSLFLEANRRIFDFKKTPYTKNKKANYPTADGRSNIEN